MPWGNWGPCGCCTASSTLVVTVNGCATTSGVAQRLAGAVATLTQGTTTIATGTTDANGLATLNFTSAGTYTLTISKSGFSTLTVNNLALAAGQNTTTRALTADANHLCSCSNCVDPIPTTGLVLSDSNGTYPLTYGTLPSTVGTFTPTQGWYTGYNVALPCFTFDVNCVPTGTTSQNVGVRHEIKCAQGVLTLQSYWYYESFADNPGVPGTTYSKAFCPSTYNTTSGKLAIGGGPCDVAQGGGLGTGVSAVTTCPPSFTATFTPTYLPADSGPSTEIYPFSGNIVMSP